MELVPGVGQSPELPRATRGHLSQSPERRPSGFMVVEGRRVIDGDEKANDILIREWPFGIRGVPVCIYHESLGRLSGLCERWPRVALGSSGDWQRRN